MRPITVLLALLFWTGFGPAGAQETSALDQRRTAYERALKDWDVADDNLSRDVFRLPTAQALERIDAVEQRRKTLEAARSQYMEIRRLALQIQAGLLKPDQSVDLETLVTIQRQHAEDIRLALEALESQVRRLKLSERMRSEELMVNKTQAVSLRSAIERHRAALAADKSPSGLERSRASTLSDVIQLELVAGHSDPTDWKQVYAQLREEVQRRSGEGSPTTAAAPGASSAGQLVLPSLAGTWVYSNPGATKSGGIYQWKSARAEIRQRGDVVDGVYECLYAVPEGEKFNPTVKFSFTGRVASEIMRFDLKPPLKGWLRVLKQSASELTISYYIQNDRENGISFGEIPENDPQTLSRMAR